ADHVGHRGRVDGRVGVGRHADHGDPAPDRRRQLRLHAAGMILAGLAQARLGVDESRRHHLAAGGEYLVCTDAGRRRAHGDDVPVRDMDVGDALGAATVEDPPAGDGDVHDGSLAASPSSRAMIDMRTAMPLVTWARMTDWAPSATLEAIS